MSNDTKVSFKYDLVNTLTAALNGFKAKKARQGFRSKVRFTDATVDDHIQVLEKHIEEIRKEIR